MTGFHGKLRQFKSNWIALAEAAPAACASAFGFHFNADDSPRFYAGDISAFWPPPATAGPPRDFPRFANSAAYDGEQLAA